MTQRTIPGPQDGIAWVTGASSGIGWELAAQLAQAGWTVAISARRQAELERLSAAYPGRMIVAAMDITDAAAVRDGLAMIEHAAGRRIVRAILNAGTYVQDTAPSFTAERFKLQLDVNLLGTANCLAPLLARFYAAKQGQLGIVTSLAGLAGLPNSVTYSTTKAGLLAMCESLKFDLARAGLHISAILPGFVKTPLTDQNKFPMPLLMEVAPAARIILRGMNAGKFFIAFPAGLAWPLRFLRILPAPVYFALVSRASGS